MDCIKTLDNIVAYVQGEIADDSLRRDIAAHIQACGSCRREEGEVRRTLDVIQEAGEEFVPSNRVWMQLLERIRIIKAGITAGDKGGPVQTVTTVETEQAYTPRLIARRVTVPRPRRAVALLASIAAAAAVAIVIVYIATTSRFAVEYIEGPGLALIRDDGTSEKTDIGHKFVKGDIVEARTVGGKNAMLRYPNGSTLTLERGAKLEFASENMVRLYAGTLRANITPEGIGFKVWTEFGEARVTGTEFTITVRKEKRQTEIRVMTGEVAFSNGNETQVVSAGSQTVASGNASPKKPFPIEMEEAPTPELTGGHKIELLMAVFDSSLDRYVSESENTPVELPPGEPLRLRFLVRNLEDEALRIPGAAEVERLFIRVSPAAEPKGYQLPIGGEFTEEEPQPDGGGFVRLESRQSYRFVCRIEPGAIGLVPGGTRYIYGVYNLAWESKIAIAVKRAATPRPDADLPPEAPPEGH
ncbi:MAG: FecR domain-containing protein [Planctomycetota bacterium]